jgi:hypothetical protein
LARLLGVSFASVNRWEQGHTRPSSLAWRQILRAEAEGLPGFDLPPGPTLANGRGALGSSGPPNPARPPPLDFGAAPAAVWAVAEGHRLGFGHCFNPAFATETALIDPLPHQRIAVYDTLVAAGGHHLRRFVPWDETVEPAEAEAGALDLFDRA